MAATKTKRNARDTLNQRALEATALLDGLRQIIDDNRATRLDWADVGDMAHLVAQLRVAYSTLAGLNMGDTYDLGGVSFTVEDF